MVGGLNTMRVGIIGGGLSGLALAYFLQDNPKIQAIEILEQEQIFGGLCRSFSTNNISYDLGPHILFSKDPQTLELIISLLGDNLIRLTRKNQIYIDGTFIRYPFENYLCDLPEETRHFCLSSFLKNQYAAQVPTNLLQAFLITFGSGITNTYLRPYNEKMWKHDPSFLDYKLIGRVPNPPIGDIINGANGNPTDGYLQQLNFYYPKKGGIMALTDAFAGALTDKVVGITDCTVNSLLKKSDKWFVHSGDQKLRLYDKIISTIPVTHLTHLVQNPIPPQIKIASAQLKHIGLVIIVLELKKDNLGDTLATLFPDKSIPFHRVTKLNYLMPNDNSILLAEITYMAGTKIDMVEDNYILEDTINTLVNTHIIDSAADVTCAIVGKLPYAYPICDLNHTANTSIIKEFYEQELGLYLCGRFGEYAYLNMDMVIERCQGKAKQIEINL